MPEDLTDLTEDTQEAPRIYREKGDLAYFAAAAFATERVRVSAQVRLSHLAKVGRASPDTERLLELAQGAESYVDGRLAHYILPHITWPWASRQKGVGKENLPKVVGLIESFARYYDIGDPLIPPFVTREPEPYLTIVRGDVVEKVGIWVEGIERLSLPSKLWRYAGYDVDPATGRARRREPGVKLGFNSELRMALSRMASSLLRAGGIWYQGGDRDQGFSRGYLGHREVSTATLAARGFTVVPTPRERMCLACNTAVVLKKARWCPDCGGPLTLKEEPPGYFFQGHLHQRVIRLMMKDWTLCLWKVWREGLGLPTPAPYDEARLAHPTLKPWLMVDREAPKSGKWD